MAKRKPSDIGYVEDLWFDDDDTPKTRNGKGKRYKARWVNDDGKERSANFTSERAAKAHLKLVARGEYANDAGKQTFREYFDRWSPNQVWAKGTIVKVNQAIDSVTFATVPLERLRRSHIEQWIKDLSVKGLAPNTIRSRYNHVHAVIRAAVADRAIPFDVASGVKLPRVIKPEKSDDGGLIIPEAAEVGALLRVADDRFAAFVGLCAFAGMRLGEAAGLKVSDIDFLKRKVRIDRQVQRVNGGGVEITPPKFGSVRTVYIPQELVTMLAEHVRLHTTGDDPDRWMFLGRNGDPLHQNSADYLWRKAKAKAGVSFRLHDLRHFYASGLIGSTERCDPVTVQRAMGHSSPSFTLNKYAHLWPTAEDRTRNAAAQMLNEALTAVRVRSQTQ